tara:strand:- start:84 stop:395 length:312 start_codon:yes stop_codon:yes gene_type:complete
MVIIYDCELTEPPSSVTCFRDVTLFTKIFLNADNLIKCPRGTRSMYWKWIKEYGAHDFVSGLLRYGEDQGGLIVASKNANVKVSLINEHNYGDIINTIQRRQG